jgi:hypothetical protein
MAVKLSEIRMLGIEADISSYSFVKGKTAYLEEDVDAMAFINAAKAKGITVELKESPPRDNSPIRYFKRYSPEMVG